METIDEDTQQEAADLVEAILECWPACNFAQNIGEQIAKGRTVSKNQFRALLKIWDKMSDRQKEEAGYSAGTWWMQE